MSDFIEIHRGAAPLVVSFPHTGTALPTSLETAFISPWLALKDTDWWVDSLYGFACDLGATTVRTRLSRGVIDCNRDPSGASLYPGQATTGLCPTETFDGEPLYAGSPPEWHSIERRRTLYFDPYHAALKKELNRLQDQHDRVVLYDAHSIRSCIPRLFEGKLPQFSIGTNGGASCAPALAGAVEALCALSGLGHVLNGRFRGGWTTRHYGNPEKGIHAIQMELAIRGYCDEPASPSPENWPPRFDPDRAAPLANILTDILKACLAFAQSR